MFIFLFINKFFPDESPIKPKAKRNTHPIITPRLPEQPKSKPTSQKSLPQNQSNKQPKKTNKVTFSDDKSTVGLFMTMDEISELVKAVKETTQAHENKTTESKGRMINFAMLIFIYSFKNLHHHFNNNNSRNFQRPLKCLNQMYSLRYHHHPR